MALKKLPIGIENFREFASDDFYYVDKTGLIADLLHNWGKVNLFTRPRRFGKSLNMSMFRAFFEIGTDKKIFDGLKISLEKDLCDEYMGQFPVVSVSLKSADALNFQDACNALRGIIGNEALRFRFLLEDEKLSNEEKKQYQSLIEFENGRYTMPDTALITSLQTLCILLEKHYDSKVILLIDEYDVPLDKAFQAGYYDEMVSLIRNMFGNALKTNDSLQFAVLTGCLRISKESIFTGLNNLKVHTITDLMYDEYFGFTDDEVKEMLAYYNLSDHYTKVKEWYNGYRFGNVSVYCPWDVINYCYDARVEPDMYPKNYWANTSGNGMVRRFIDKATSQTRKEIEQLIAGETVTKEVCQELTYGELDNSIENLWSVLFTTGYLTNRGRGEGRQYHLAVPNLEIRELFVTQIQEWFRESTRSDNSTIEGFCAAFPAGDTELIEKQLNRYLWNSISIRDTAVRSDLKENFYHGMLLGILQYEENWYIKSNAESGNGYSDILIETSERTGIVIELKYAGDGKLDKCCEEALKQIEEKSYDSYLIDEGMDTIIKYGIAFYKKKCKVVRG